MSALNHLQGLYYCCSRYRQHGKQTQARQPTSSRKAICSSSRRELWEEWRPTAEDQHDQSIRVISADLRGCEDSPHDEPSRLPGPPYLNRQS